MKNNYTVFRFNTTYGFNEISGLLNYFIVNLTAGFIYIGIGAIKQRDTHCNGSDVEIFLLNQIYGFNYITKIKHFPTS